jgi:NAD(P)-dependent dehydrogenase (short-subunit alcohol dehydrogenase family)
MQLAGKVALITGAGSGIGKATALLMGAEGAQVAALSRTESEVQRTADEIIRAGGQAIAVKADVSDYVQMQAAIDKIIATWGQIDVVFANAGINGVWAPLDELSLDEWNKTLNINLTGTFITVKLALPYLKRNGGSVIVCSSVNGTRVFSNTGATVYSCTKAAQVAFTKMLALELAPFKVRVNVVCPGWIETDIGDNMEVRNIADRIGHITVPLTGNKPARSEQVASVVLFLASDAASHVTGTEMWVDGAESLTQGY